MPRTNTPLGEAYSRGVIDQLIVASIEAGGGQPGRSAAVDVLREQYPGLTFRSRQAILRQFEYARGTEASPLFPVGNPAAIEAAIKRSQRIYGYPKPFGERQYTTTITVPITYRDKHGRSFEQQEIMQFQSARELTDEEIQAEIAARIEEINAFRQQSDSPTADNTGDYEYEIQGVSYTIV